MKPHFHLMKTVGGGMRMVNFDYVQIIAPIYVAQQKMSGCILYMANKVELQIENSFEEVTQLARSM